MKLYREGLIDEILSEKNAHQHYKITDEDGKTVYEHTYTWEIKISIRSFGSTESELSPNYDYVCW